MRKKIFSLFVWALMIFIMCSSAWADVPIDEAHFPDPVFRNYVNEFDTISQDGILSDEEIYNVKSIPVNNMNIFSLQGIEYFTNLRKLNFAYNRSKLTTLDLSNNKFLNELDCSYTIAKEL